VVISYRSDVLVSPAEAMVQDCLGGDEAAWRGLHRRYYPVAASFLRKLGVREPELDDACQDVFIQMFRYLPRFRGEADLKTWLYRLCVTQARRTRRRAVVADTLRKLLARAPSDTLVSDHGFSESLANERIQAALGALSPGERAVFVLYELEGVPGKQIAEIVGCPEASVWRRLHYARRAFREFTAAGSSAASSPVISRAPRS